MKWKGIIPPRTPGKFPEFPQILLQEDETFLKMPVEVKLLVFNNYISGN